jgi:uncharacterized protein GlcG (DUF336 family)
MLSALAIALPVAIGQTPGGQAAVGQSNNLQFAPGLVRTDVITVRALTMKFAMKVAQAALEACTAANPHVAVVVVDSSGNPRLIMVADGAKASLVDNARRKGLTAATLRQVTSVEQKMVADNPLLIIPPNALDLIEPGGVPIRAANIVIGGIGVEGGDPMEAEKCAQAGVDKLKDDLQPELPPPSPKANAEPAGVH